MQTINTTGMNLLVNNSWSGSSTIGALNSNNAAVVDIYTETGITPSNAADYMLSNEASHIHPNESGMDKITEVFLNRLLEEFSN